MTNIKITNDFNFERRKGGSNERRDPSKASDRAGPTINLDKRHSMPVGKASKKQAKTTQVHLRSNSEFDNSKGKMFAS